MANEIDTMTTPDAPVVVETPIEPKKQRQPRTKKANSEAASGDDAAEPAVTSKGAAAKLKRGRKAKSIDSAITASEHL